MAEIKDIAFGASDGADVEDSAVISQIAELIVATPLASIPQMPNMGSDVPYLLDSPVSRFGEIITSCKLHIEQQIPGATVTSVQMSDSDPETGQVTVRPVVQYDGKP